MDKPTLTFNGHTQYMYGDVFIGRHSLTDDQFVRTMTGCVSPAQGVLANHWRRSSPSAPPFPVESKRTPNCKLLSIAIGGTCFFEHWSLPRPPSCKCPIYMPVKHTLSTQADRTSNPMELGGIITGMWCSLSKGLCRPLIPLCSKIGAHRSMCVISVDQRSCTLLLFSKIGGHCSLCPRSKEL